MRDDEFVSLRDAFLLNYLLIYRARLAALKPLFLPTLTPQLKTYKNTSEPFDYCILGENRDGVG